MTDAPDYEKWETAALIEESHELYEQYLAGADVLDDLHAIAEVLRDRKNG